VPIALAFMEECTVCPRECLTNRISGDVGECNIPAQLKISSANLHFGEEPPISGINGSGTIFLSGCNLHCVYCQNYPISQYHNGEYYSTSKVAIYNSSGYDSIEMLKLLDGVIDIYMPDMRYADSKHSKSFSDVADYPEINRAVIKEMHRQVGILQVVDGVAVKGLLIRHLVLPGDISGSKVIFDFIANEISKDTYVAVMSQYFPAYNAVYPFSVVLS